SAADNVGEAVAVHVAGSDVDAAGEGHVVGEKLPEKGAVTAVVDMNIRPAAGTRPGDDVRHAIAVDVADGHTDAAGEIRGVGEEAEPELSRRGVKDLHVRPAAGVGARDEDCRPDARRNG